MSRFAIALLLVVACKKEKAAAPPPAPAPDPQVSIDAAAPVAVDADTPDASPDDAGVLDALSSKGTSTCAPAECYMPAEKACYVPDPAQGICGKPGAVCRRCKPR